MSRNNRSIIMHFCSGYPNLSPYLLHLGAQIVSSTPDALIYLSSCRDVGKENAIAVIKVKFKIIQMTRTLCYTTWSGGTVDLLACILWHVYIFSTSIVVFYFKNVIIKEAGWSTNYPSDLLYNVTLIHSAINSYIVREKPLYFIASKFDFPLQSSPFKGD